MTYFLIDIAALSIPLIFAFHPKLQFYKKFKSLFLGLIVTMAVYISWDVVFTVKGHWKFNEEYLMGLDLLHLPIEEWLFFVCIPFACTFTYHCIKKLLPNYRLPTKAVNLINIGFIALLVYLIMFHTEKAYTSFNALVSVLILFTVMLVYPKLLNRFYPIYLILLIPFFAVNGILTGTMIKDEIVWYNDLENLGIRIGTVPVEDLIYAFGMILLTVFVTELSHNRSSMGIEQHHQLV